MVVLALTFWMFVGQMNNYQQRSKTESVQIFDDHYVPLCNQIKPDEPEVKAKLKLKLNDTQ